MIRRPPRSTCTDRLGPVAPLFRSGGRVDRDVNGGGAIGRRDAGRDAEPPLGVDADGECGAELFGIPVRHLRQAELVAALAGEGEADQAAPVQGRSEEHTSELQSLMRTSYAVFCLKKKTNKIL